MRLFREKLRELRRHAPSRRDWLMIVVGAVLTCAIGGVVMLMHHSQTALPVQKEGITIPWLPDTVRRWQDPINEMAKKYNIDANAVAIVMTIESGGYSKAGSEADAQGLMQITPLTAKDIAAKFLRQPTANYNLSDPHTNIEFGTAYLAYLRKEFGSWKQGPTWDDTVELIAAGYNGGPGAANSLEQGIGLTDTQTVVYSRDAFNMWRERHAADSPTYDRWLERGGQRLIDLAKAEK